MLHVSSTALAPLDFLRSIGRVFTCFDQRDSGNVSFGVEVDGTRYFVKTAGDPQVAAGLIYDFAAEALHVCDLDHYHLGAYRNTVGRMFGSTRFMAPEEFELGLTLDERTTVFMMGRTISIFLPTVAARVAKVACAADPDRRYPSVAALAAAFTDALGSS